jgi:beta-xylosidase
MSPRKVIGKIAVVVALLVLFQIGFGDRQSANNKPVWVPDNGDGTYTNPIVHADYSDPDVIRVGDDFYLTASSFNCAPGLPLLHSKDLVNWRIIGYVFQEQVPGDVFAKPQHGNGVWAPAIRYHNGSFYIFYPDPDYGIYMVKARHPAGPWTAPLLIKQAKGWIDPCPFWDNDGDAYLVHAWANSRAGIKSIITVNRMSADGTKILDEGRTVFDGHEHHPTIEGPKLYKRNGYYYIFAPAGGVPTGWQTVLRSRNIFGPYEDRIVMDQGQTKINGPHQGGWVELKSGESWFVHFQDRGPYGRIIHLQPMTWKNDWPVIGVDNDGDGKGEPVTTYRKPDVGKVYTVEVPQTDDEFNSRNLGLQWQWHANYQPQWLSLTARPGWLRLNSVLRPEGSVNLWSVPNLLLQKLPAEKFTVTTKIELSKLAVGERAALVMMGMDYSYLAVVRTDMGFRLVKMVCKDAINGGKEIEEAVVPLKETSIVLRVVVSDNAVSRFSYSTDGKEFLSLGEPFTAREGRWIGAKVGVFCLTAAGAQGTGYADFDWFRFQ